MAEPTLDNARDQGWKVLKFAPWQSAVDDAFWDKLGECKLDKLRLSEEPIPITGFYAPANHAQVSSPLSLSGNSLPGELGGGHPSELQSSGHRFSVPGTLHNTNTLESFKALDRPALLEATAREVWDAIMSGRAEEDPSLLVAFAVISFSDLKKWGFYYWFACPGLVMPEPATSAPPQMASLLFTEPEAAAVLQACQSWPDGQPTHPTAASEAGGVTAASGRGGPSAFLLHVRPDSEVSAHRLTAWEHLQTLAGQVTLAFYDPFHAPENPGWPLRNLLALAAARWRARSLRVLSLRMRRGKVDLACSPVFGVQLNAWPGLEGSARCPTAVGWELNARGKSGPRFRDLAMFKDPVNLALAAADLNLKLMRWRLLPSLDLPKLASTRCLLLGAGTLGCQVARGLMAWGVRRITLVDSGRVSMSNPLRQSLYTLEDCLEGGKPKATAAAESLQRIFPGAEARGVRLAIPMPGHPVAPAEAAGVAGDCEELRRLVAEHDVVFLLTDTRESRWLPTLLAAALDKIAINAALGFDTFLVLRHGASPHAASTAERAAAAGCPPEVGGDGQQGGKGGGPGQEPRASLLREQGPGATGPGAAGGRLGCYFCNDVVAPLDSTANRTLDQQCTVTRPGLAPIAAALAVELAVALLHHPQGVRAPADVASGLGSSPDLPLGIVPHQVRGFLAQFSQLVIVGQAFDRCTACSSTVVEEYLKHGFQFLHQVFNSPSYLEDLTGLTEMLRQAEDLAVDWDESGEEEEFTEL